MDWSSFFWGALFMFLLGLIGFCWLVGQALGQDEWRDHMP